MPSGLVVVDTVVDSRGDVARAAVVEVVSKRVLLVAGVVAGVVISRVEPRGRVEVVAEVGLVPGEGDDVCAGFVLVTLVSVTFVVL